MIKWWRPWRRFLMFVALHAPQRLTDKICCYLYPDDAVITFHADHIEIPPEGEDYDNSR